MATKLMIRQDRHVACTGDYQNIIQYFNFKPQREQTRSEIKVLMENTRYGFLD
jgi:hypothetical protein